MTAHHTPLHSAAGSFGGIMEGEQMIGRLWRRLRDWWRERNMSADELWADAVMTQRHRQQWQRTRGTIEQRLQAMLIARNEDGQPCWTQEDWVQIYRLLRGVQEGRE